MRKPGRFSAGNLVTIFGAVLLSSASLLLAYGLIVARTWLQDMSTLSCELLAPVKMVDSVTSPTK
jgi:hypothetical protein